MKLRNLFLALCAAGWILPTAAQEKKEFSLVVYKTGGPTEAFSLEQFDKLTFTAADMQVWLQGLLAPVNCPFGDIVKLTFEDAVPTGTETSVATPEEVQITYVPSEEAVRISGSGLPAAVWIANVQGAVLHRQPLSDAVTEIRLQTLPAGAYIVCVQTPGGRYTAKFVKR